MNPLGVLEPELCASLDGNSSVLSDPCPKTLDHLKTALRYWDRVRHIVPPSG